MSKSSDEEEEIVRGNGEKDLAFLRLWDGEKSMGEEDFRPTRPVSRLDASLTSSNGFFSLLESSRKGHASGKLGLGSSRPSIPNLLKGIP